MNNAASDYDTARATFQWDCPERFNFARDVIDRWAEQPDRPAMLWVDDNGNEERRTFADIRDASCRVANALTTAGIRRGDTVIVVMGRELAWWEILAGCLRMGAIASPGTTQLSARDIAYRVDASGATAIIADGPNALKAESIRGECPSLKACITTGSSVDNWLDYAQITAAASADFATADTAADEEALCYFTSGTTGYPKMAMHAHSYGLAHITTGRYWLDLTENDLHWNCSDNGWAKAAWSSFFGPWNCGSALFVHHAQSFSPTRTLELLQTYPITTFCGAPTIYRLFVQQPLDGYRFTHLRHCVGAGEPLNPEVIETWKRHTGLTIKDGYGQTETVLLCGNYPSIEARFGSMGKPAPGIDLAVIDDDGVVLAPGREGDVAVRVKPQRPLGMFLEYKGNPEKTAACFKGDWYLTGDRAMTDEDGYFWFVGRSDDVILSAGYRIGPFEVESALIEHPAVAESAVVASPDAERGEVVKAFVVLASGYDASDELVKTLQDHVKAVTAPYKYPRRIEFVDRLPKTVSGKIRRVELREREWKQ